MNRELALTTDVFIPHTTQEEIVMARYIVDVMPQDEILDPQGKAVTQALARLGYHGVVDVRQGKRFEITTENEMTEQTLHTIAQKVLTNTVIEKFTYTKVE